MNRNPMVVGAIMLGLGAVLGAVVLADPDAEWTDATRRLGIPMWILSPLCVAGGVWFIYKGIRERSQK